MRLNPGEFSKQTSAPLIVRISLRNISKRFEIILTEIEVEQFRLQMCHVTCQPYV